LNLLCSVMPAGPTVSESAHGGASDLAQYSIAIMRTATP